MARGSSSPPAPLHIPASLTVDMSSPGAASVYGSYRRLDFQYMQNDGFSVSTNVNWEETVVLGRSEPFYQYSNSGPRTFELQLGFLAEGFKANTLESASRLEVLKQVAFLESLAYPIRQGGRNYRPAACLLVIGKLYACRVIMAQAPSVDYPGPWVQDSMLPLAANVSVTLTESSDSNPPTAAEILSQFN